MDIIHSKDNALIKQLRQLKDRKHRTASGEFLVEGLRFVEEAFYSGSRVSYVLVNEKNAEKWKEASQRLKIQEETRVLMVSEAVFRTVSGTDTPQGVIAVVSSKTKTFEHRNGFYVLADKVQDPGNLGTIIRTAHAGGALGVICTKGTVDVYNEKTLRSTMGSVFYIPVLEDNNLEFVKNLKMKGFKIITSSLDTDKNFFDIDLTENVVICVGNEGNGISEDIYSLSDIRVKIPMPGGAESLNAAVAASIMIYESVRQRIIK